MGICSRSRTFFFSLQWIERSKKKVEANGNLRRSAGSYGKPWSEVTSFFLSFFVFSPFFHCSSGPAAAAPVCCVRVSLLGCRPNAAAAAALSIHSFASTLFVDTRSFIQTCCRVAFCPFSVFFFLGCRVNGSSHQRVATSFRSYRKSILLFFLSSINFDEILTFFFQGGVEHDIGEVNRNEHAERIEKVTSLAQLRKVRPCVIFPPPGLLRLESFPS